MYIRLGRARGLGAWRYRALLSEEQNCFWIAQDALAGAHWDRGGLQAGVRR